MFNKMSLYRVKKGFVYLRYFGPKEFLIRLKERIRIQKIDYEKWYENHRRTEEELESQRQEVFAYAPLISIVVPVYQAPEEFLRQMILSVCRQTYKNWELCMTVSDEERHRMEEIVGGFEEQLAVAFNDVDFCLKVRRCGYLVVYDPYVKLYHYESRSRGAEDNEEKIRRYQCEIDYVRRTWSEIMEKGDPMYNPNLTLVKCDYSLREKENG